MLNPIYNGDYCSQRCPYMGCNYCDKFKVQLVYEDNTSRNVRYSDCVCVWLQTEAQKKSMVTTSIGVSTTPRSAKQPEPAHNYNNALLKQITSEIDPRFMTEETKQWIEEIVGIKESGKQSAEYLTNLVINTVDPLNLRHKVIFRRFKKKINDKNWYEYCLTVNREENSNFLKKLVTDTVFEKKIGIYCNTPKMCEHLTRFSQPFGPNGLICYKYSEFNNPKFLTKTNNKDYPIPLIYKCQECLKDQLNV